MNDALSKEIFKEQLAITREELPFSLKTKDLCELMNINKKTLYLKLEKKLIPGAQKYAGEWRVGRDVFLSWWYCINLEKENEIN